MRLHLYIYKVAICLCTVLLSASCTQQTVYFHTEPVDLQGWTRSEAYHFMLPSEILSDSCTAWVGVRFSHAYPFVQLAMEVKQHTSATTEHTDTIYMQVYDAYGAMKGKGLQLISYTAPLPLYPVDADTLRITLRHIMSADTLMGVADVSLKIDKTS